MIPRDSSGASCEPAHPARAGCQDPGCAEPAARLTQHTYLHRLTVTACLSQAAGSQAVWREQAGAVPWRRQGLASIRGTEQLSGSRVGDATVSMTCQCPLPVTKPASICEAFIQ